MFYGQRKRIQEHTTLFLNELLIGKETLLEAYRQFFQLKVFTDTNFFEHDIGLVNGSLNTENSSSQHNYVLKLWAQKLEENIDCLRQFFALVEKSFSIPADDMKDNMAALNFSLQAYSRSLTMDAEFVL